MSWEDEFLFGNSKGENTLDVIPPVAFIPFKCEECKNEHHPDGPITYNENSLDPLGEPLMLECTSTRYIGQEI